MTHHMNKMHTKNGTFYLILLSLYLRNCVYAFHKIKTGLAAKYFPW